MTAPEFARPERTDTIGDDPRSVSIVATPAECAALGRRFGLVAVDRLGGDFILRRDAAGISVDGRVSAVVTQACSVTGEPLPAAIDEPVALRFVDGAAGVADEVELDDAGIDVIDVDDGAVDLGEVAAETMALALDPFPRGPNAEAALREADVLSEERAGPFGALAALKDRLGRR